MNNRPSRRSSPLQSAPYISAARLVTVILLIAVPVLWLGAVEDVGLAVTCGLAALAIGVQRLDGARTTTTSPLSLALLLLTAWVGLQLVPLPPGMLRVVSPRAAEIWTSARGGWAPISLDPPGSAFGFATLAVITAGHFSFRDYASDAARAKRLQAIVASVVLGFAIVGLVHAMTGATHLYGVYAPRNLSVNGLGILTPLINANHAAAVVAIGPPLFLGYALTETDLGQRIVHSAAAAFCAAVVVMTQSRGGIAVLFLELLAFAAYSVLRFRKRGALAAVLSLVVTVAAVLVVAGTIAAEGIDRELRGGAEKLLLVPATLRMSRDFILTGVGRGAFSSTFFGYEGTLAVDGRYSQPENWLASLAVEVGWPTTLGFVVLCAVGAVRALRGASRRPSSVAAGIALVGLVIHDLGDFALDFAGVGLIAVAVAASIERRERGERDSLPRRRPAAIAVAALPLVVLGPIVLGMFFRQRVEDEAARVAEYWTASRLAEHRADIARAAARHPAEPYFPLALAVADLRDDASGPALLRALRLGPWRAQTHFWFARWLGLHGRRGQAWVEYRETIRLSPIYARVVLADVMRLGPSLDEVLHIAITDLAADAASLELTKANRDAEADIVDVMIVEHFPPATDARVRRIARASRDGKADVARARVDELIAIAPTDPRGHLLRASLTTDPIAAEAGLEAALKTLGDVPPLLEDLIRRRGKRLGLAAVAGELERYRTALVAAGQPLLGFHGVQAEVSVARGDPGGAISKLIEAANLSSEPEPYLERAATLAEATGQRNLAAQLWQRLVDKHPDRRDWALALSRAKGVVQPATSATVPAISSGPAPVGPDGMNPGATGSYSSPLPHP